MLFRPDQMRTHYHRHSQRKWFDPSQAGSETEKFEPALDAIANLHARVPL